MLIKGSELNHDENPDMKFKMVLVVKTNIGMDVGKIASQTAHGAMKFMIDNGVFDTDNKTLSIQLDEASLAWLMGNFKKVALAARSDEEFDAIYNKALEKGITVSKVTDNGLTVFNGVKTDTVLALGPCDEKILNKITGNLPLLKASLLK